MPYRSLLLNIHPINIPVTLALLFYRMHGFGVFVLSSLHRINLSEDLIHALQ